jgi:hypothetical protein
MRTGSHWLLPLSAFGDRRPQVRVDLRGRIEHPRNVGFENHGHDRLRHPRRESIRLRARIVDPIMGTHFTKPRSSLLREVNLACLQTRGDGSGDGSWNRTVVFSKPANVEFDRSFDPPERHVDSLARGNAPREIWDGRAPITARIAIDPHYVLKCFHHVAHRDSAAATHSIGGKFVARHRRVPLSARFSGASILVRPLRGLPVEQPGKVRPEQNTLPEIDSLHQTRR